MTEAKIKHTKQTSQPNDPNYDVSAKAWNENHTVTFGTPSDVSKTNAEGTSTELVRKDHVHALHAEYHIPLVALATEETF